MTAGLADFFRYNLWANSLVLDVCANLDDTQLDASVEGTFGSIRETLIHIVGSEESYVRRLTGQLPARQYDDGVFPGFDELRQRTHQSGERLIAFAEQFNPDLILQLSYQGQPYNVPAVVVVAQAITHATDHRSQVATILSQQGVTLLEFDCWAYYDEVVKPD
jgi:uncharacterized damage-inducible protein DinB